MGELVSGVNWIAVVAGFILSFMLGWLLMTVKWAKNQIPARYDIDWFMRAREAGAVVRETEDVVGYYRRHGENMSSTTEAEVANAAMLKLLRRSLQRRRNNDTALQDEDN